MSTTEFLFQSESILSSGRGRIRWRVILGILALALAWLPVETASASAGRLLVQPKAGVDDATLARIVAQHGGQMVGAIKGIGVHLVQVPAAAQDQVAVALAHNPRISFAERDRLLPPSETIPDDPRYADAWHLPKINAPLAWDTTQASGVTVAVLDTGVDLDHPDLVDRLVNGWNAASQNTDVSDVYGHGTKVAGTVGATGNNGTGVASVAWRASIMPVRVTNASDGYAYYSTIAQGLVWAADHGARVANISYDVTPSSTVASAADYMMNQGGVVLVAAGNSGSNPGYSDSPSMISVSATTSGDTKANWSSYGAYVDLAAPGAGILTTTNGGGYGSPSGTSFASPVAAGVAALIMAANGNLTSSQVEGGLENTALDLGATGRDDAYGHGRVDAAAAVAEALATVQADTTPPTAAITAPVAGSTVAGSVTVTVDASDNQSVAGVELRVNGVAVASDAMAPFEFVWDSTQVADGSVTLRAVASDEAGNQASDSLTVTVDNVVDPIDTTPPQVQILSPADGAMVSGNVSIDLRASDDTRLELLNGYVDGMLMGATSSGALRFKWNTRKVAAGDHTITAEALDGAGNRTQQTITVSVSSSSPGKGGGKGNSR